MQQNKDPKQLERIAEQIANMQPGQSIAVRLDNPTERYFVRELIRKIFKRKK